MVQLLERTEHHAFPVQRLLPSVIESEPQYTLVGSILRQQLVTIINKRLFVAATDIGTPRHTKQKQKTRRNSVVCVLLVWL